MKMAATARALAAIAAIIIVISSIAPSAMATAPAPEPEGFSGCEDISGTWTTDAARFVELESTDPENPSNSVNSMTAADKDWGMEMSVYQYDCVFVANLTVANDDDEVFKKQYAGTIQPLPSGSSRLVIEEAIPMSGSGDVPLWLKKGVSVAFTEDGGNLISIDYLGRDGDTIVGVSALLGREGAPVVSYECPDIVGSWKSGTYDSISADEAGKIIELQQLNMTLEVIEQKDCAFFGINSWSNGVIGDDEVVAGLIHANGEAYTMMEFPPALLEKSVTLGLIMGDITENQTMTFEYAGINSEEQRAASFSTTLTRSEAALPLESYPGQKQCADIDMLGSWTSQPFVETELIVGESEADADDNITVSISVTVQHGCRFGGYIQESNAETKKVFTGTFHNDEVVFEVVETGVAQGELDGLAVGAILDPATLSWSFSGHRIDENGESHAVTYYTVLEKDGM